jgi:hypothetical protein
MFGTFDTPEEFKTQFCDHIKKLIAADFSLAGPEGDKAITLK